MRNNVKYKAWVELLIAVASVIFGIIIGPIIEKVTDPLFSSESRVALMGILVLGLLIIIGLTVVGIYIRRNETQDEKLEGTIQEIRRKMGLSAQFVNDLPRDEGTGEIYQEAATIISQAEKEIWVLWSRNPHLARRTEEDRRSMNWKEARDAYHQTLLLKCKEHKRDTFFYRRILQIQESLEIKDGVLKSSMLSPTMITHCRELLEHIRHNPEVAVLKHAPIFLPHTLVLVDEQYILWEIDGIDPETQSDYMDAMLIFDDSDKKFIKYLKSFFMKVDVHSRPVKEIAD